MELVSILKLAYFRTNYFTFKNGSLVETPELVLKYTAL